MAKKKIRKRRDLDAYEEIRRKGIRLLKEGKSISEVARLCRRSRQSVWDWRKRYNGNEGDDVIPSKKHQLGRKKVFDEDDIWKAFNRLFNQGTTSFDREFWKKWTNAKLVIRIGENLKKPICKDNNRFKAIMKEVRRWRNYNND